MKSFRHLYRTERLWRAAFVAIAIVTCMVLAYMAGSVRAQVRYDSLANQVDAVTLLAGEIEYRKQVGEQP